MAAPSILIPRAIKAPLPTKKDLANFAGKIACEKSLMTYIKDAWAVLEPTIPLINNWHIELIAEYLEAVTRGDVKRLIINCPPRFSKSRTVSVFWPTFCWARSAANKLGPDDILSGSGSNSIFASYNDDLATDHSTDRRTVMESPWYRDRWGDRIAFTRDQNRKTNYRNTNRGMMVAVSIAGASGLGKGGSAIVIDDPHNTKEAESEADRKSAIETYRSTLSTRHNDKKRGVIVVIMQRLNEVDLSGYLLELGGWEHLKIQGEYEERRVYSMPRSKRTILREEDHTDILDANGNLISRRDDGGLLCPAREGPKEIAERKLNLGAQGFAGQYQQNPAPQGGALFKREWWRYWRTLPKLHRLIMVMDTAYTEGDESSYSNADIWGFADIGFVLIDNWHARVGFPELKRSAIWLASKWNPEVMLIEAKASGNSLIQELKRPIPQGSNEPRLHSSISILPINPEKDKYTRAVAITPIPEAGLVWLPDKTMPPDPAIAPEGYGWVEGYQNELELFPAGKLNDRVDTMVHAITYLRGQGSVLDFYRRLKDHQNAVEAAETMVAHGRKPPAPPEDSVMLAYKRSQAMWAEKMKEQP